jgi:hypothetical protein
MVLIVCWEERRRVPDQGRMWGRQMVFINCGEASPTDEGKKDGLNKVWWIGDWEELRHAVPRVAGPCWAFRGCSAGAAAL